MVGMGKQNECEQHFKVRMATIVIRVMDLVITLQPDLA